MSVCVQVGLAVLHATMDHEVAERVGAKGEAPEGSARRTAHEPGARPGGDRRRRGAPHTTASTRPSWRMLHGVATRSYAATLEDVGEVEAFGNSKSRVGERFLGQMGAKLQEHLSRRINDLTPVVDCLAGSGEPVERK